MIIQWGWLLVTGLTYLALRTWQPIGRTPPGLDAYNALTSVQRQHLEDDLDKSNG